MKIRKEKPDDQENIDKAVELLTKLVKSTDIEPSLWVSACLSCIAASYQGNGFSFSDFKKEMTMATNHYKLWWDKHE